MSFVVGRQLQQLGPVGAVVVGRCLGEGDSELVGGPFEPRSSGVVEGLVAPTSDVEDQTDGCVAGPGGSAGGGCRCRPPVVVTSPAVVVTSPAVVWVVVPTVVVVAVPPSPQAASTSIATARSDQHA